MESKIELTRVERTILTNQFRLLSAMEGQSKSENLWKAKVLEEGHEYFYDEIIVSDEVKTTNQTLETMDILEMFDFIERAIKNLSETEREELGKDLERIRYKGFDGSHDPHYSILTILFESDRFKDYEEKENNSHTKSSLINYRKMLAAFSKFKSKAEIGKDNLLLLLESLSR